MLTLYLVILLVIGIYLLIYVKGYRTRKLFAGLPTYPRLPLLGNVHWFLGGGRIIFQRLKEISEIADQKNLPFALWMGYLPLLIISDPEDVKTVTNTFIEKPYYYNFGRIWLGNGLITAPAAIWKHNIKNIGSAFNATVVDSYQPVFDAQAHNLVQQLKGEVGRKPFDIMKKYIAFITLEAICQTALGVSQISESIITTEYYNAFNNCMELLLSRGLNILQHPNIVYRLTPSYKQITKSVAILHNVSEMVMTKRTIEREKMKNNNALEANKSVSPKFKAFLDILLDLRSIDPTLTHQQIKSEVDTIIVAGQETVATTLFYIFLMIGCKPQVQEKLYNEMHSIFGDSTRPVVKEDLDRMIYCEAVIYETLRMYPPVPGVMRYADRDLQLKNCTVPKGTCCCINTWGAGRSKRVWGPDAEEYRPERWLEEKAPGHPAAFLAFSYGRRACIGKKYAMAIMKTIMAHCVRELVLVSQADKLELRIDLALRPASGHLIQVKTRQ
ncbi:cytochrome P450 4c3-like [Galleria mellonella]|uniref:Cytochrome P450 4c3-like n=1 Tax=Galleria mellonella TaxID=7137 RepID=A0ABM3MIL8_GALME|nr:cytochrome P450 4c3-like [Galleria mellonella]